MKNYGQSGFTLIQVMFVVSIAGAVMFLIMDNQLVSTKIKKTSDFNSQVTELSEQIAELVSNPYICSASVAGVKIGSIAGATTLTSGSKIGTVVGGDVGFTSLKDAIFNPSYNLTPRPPMTSFYQLRSPRAHLIKGSEFRPGIMIDDMRLVHDGVRDFIRISFKPKANIEGAKLGGKIVNKDFYLIGEKNLAKDEFLECNSIDHDANLREVCTSQKGSWDPILKKCEMKDLIKNPAEKIPVWLHADGVLKTVASFNTVVGSVSCPCDRKQCARAPYPCTCALPTCESRFAACAGGRCVLGNSDNYNICVTRIRIPPIVGPRVCVDHNCRWTKPCGLALPPDGHVINMK
jgi:hypothetical protein